MSFHNIHSGSTCNRDDCLARVLTSCTTAAFGQEIDSVLQSQVDWLHNFDPWCIYVFVEVPGLALDVLLTAATTACNKDSSSYFR